MKKNRILLISVVGTLFFVLLVTNLTQYLQRADALEENQAPNQEALDKLRERAAQNTSSEGASLSTASGLRGMNANTVAAMKGEVPEIPSIELPSPQLYKPTFEPNSTTTQWYKDDSYQKVNAKKREKNYDANGGN